MATTTPTTTTLGLFDLSSDYTKSIDGDMPPLYLVSQQHFSLSPAFLVGRHRKNRTFRELHLSQSFYDCLDDCLKNYLDNRTYLFKKEAKSFVIDVLEFDFPRPLRYECVEKGKAYNPLFVPSEFCFSEDYGNPLHVFSNLIEFTTTRKEFRKSLKLQLKCLKAKLELITQSHFGACRVAFIMDITISDAPKLESERINGWLYDFILLWDLKGSIEKCVMCDGAREDLRWKLPCGQACHPKCFLSWMLIRSSCPNCPDPEKCSFCFYQAEERNRAYWSNTNI